MRLVTASLVTLLVVLVSPAIVTSQSYFGPGSKCPRPARDDRRCRCIPIRDYEDLRGAILRMDDSECKCFEPFSVVKAPSAPPINMDNMRRVTIKCQEFGRCEINGQGMHFLISGDRSEVTISGFRFVGATESAIVVMTSTGSSPQDGREQLFCDNEFINNENNSHDGGAIKVGARSRAYVANSLFQQNSAARMGGAISGEASMLQVLDSTFTANVAALGGAISSNKPEAVLVLADNEFDGNVAGLGQAYGPAVAANGQVQDFGNNKVSSPKDFMCLSCKLIAGVRPVEVEGGNGVQGVIENFSAGGYDNRGDGNGEDDKDEDDYEEDENGNYKRNPEFNNYDRYADNHWWGPFHLKLYFEKGYQWQGQYKDMNLCMKTKYSPRRVEGKGDPLALDRCDEDEGDQRFFAYGRSIRLDDDRDLCLTHVDDRAIELHRCDGSISQEWDRVQKEGKFRISPATDHRRCATNHHHPRKEERIYLDWCHLAEDGDTLYWIVRWNESG